MHSSCRIVVMASIEQLHSAEPQTWTHAGTPYQKLFRHGNVFCALPDSLLSHFQYGHADRGQSSGSPACSAASYCLSRYMVKNCLHHAPASQPLPVPAHQCGGVVLTMLVRRNSIRQPFCCCSFTAGHCSLCCSICIVVRPQFSGDIMHTQSYQGNTYVLA